MGSEQSSRKRENKESSVNLRDVPRALEHQRLIYEQKKNNLTNENKHDETTVTSPAASSRSDVHASTSQQQTSTAGLTKVHEVLENTKNSGATASSALTTVSYSSLRAAREPQTRHEALIPAHEMVEKVNYAETATTAHQQSTPAFPRSRSQSRQRGGDNEVNCVTCGQMYGERMYQCDQGHSSCEVCKTRQVACGACRLRLIDRRYFDLEKYITETRVRCPNSGDGCQLFIKIGNTSAWKECPFQVLQCPSLGSCCNWRGNLSQLAEHFKEMHPLHIQGEVDKEMFISNIINTSHTMHYIQIGPFNFLFHIKVSQPDARIYMAVQLIGTKHSAAKWDYEIHIYKKSEPRRKYQFIDICSSASEPLQEIISNTRCAVIPQDYAKTFISGGTIAYKFYIKTDDPKTN